jgi:hypothetical protein
MRNLLLIAILLSAPAAALDFKGVVMGEPIDAAALNEKLGAPDSLGNRVAKLEDFAVTSKVTLAGDRVDKLKVDFRPLHFDEFAAAATKKWGQPKSQKVPMQNGFGAQFQNNILTWEREGWTITMYQYVEADSGSLIIERTVAKAIAPKDRL